MRKPASVTRKAEGLPIISPARREASAKTSELLPSSEPHLQHDQLPILINRKNRSHIGCQTIPDVFFESEPHESLIVRGIFGLHEGKKVGMGILVERFGDLRRVAVDREMIFHLVDDGACEELVFDIDTVF